MEAIRKIWVAGLRHFFWVEKASKVYMSMVLHRIACFLDISGLSDFLGFDVYSLS